MWNDSNVKIKTLVLCLLFCIISKDTHQYQGQIRGLTKLKSRDPIQISFAIRAFTSKSGNFCGGTLIQSNRQLFIWIPIGHLFVAVYQSVICHDAVKW